MRTLRYLLLLLLLISFGRVVYATSPEGTSTDATAECQTQAEAEWEKIKDGYKFTGEYNETGAGCSDSQADTAAETCENHTTCETNISGLMNLDYDTLIEKKKEYQQCLNDKECEVRIKKTAACNDKISALRKAHCTLYMTNLAYEQKVCVATKATDAPAKDTAQKAADAFKVKELKDAQDKYEKAIQAFNQCQMEKGTDENLNKEINTYRKALVSIDQLLYSKARVDTQTMGSTKSAGDYVAYFITLLLGLAGTTAIVTIVIAGFMMVMSAANPDLKKKAMSTLVSAVIGLVFVFGAYLLVRFVQALL